MDSIQIEGLELECIIGVRPAERKTRQLVRVDLDMGLDLSRAGQSGRIGQTVDYSQVALEIDSMLGFRDYQLLEVAAEEICAMLLGTHPALERVEISIQKPAALKGRAKSGGVRVLRERKDASRKPQPGEFCTIELLLETHEAELRLLHLEAGGRAPADRTSAVEWLVTGHVEGDGGTLAVHEPRAFPGGRVFPYVNSGNSPATIFSCLHRLSK